MRVGILTFHRANNYGAVLQCYALQQALRTLGYDAMVVDYKQPFIERVYKRFSWRYLLTLLFTRPQAIGIYLMNCEARGAVQPLFHDFRTKHLKLTRECGKDNIPCNIDTYIVGSDQLWSHNCTNGIDPTYYGDFARHNNSSIVGYAISSTARYIKKVPANRLRLFSQNFASLSFREQVVKELATPHCECPTRIDIDPTLLLNQEEWSKITSPRWESRRYVLLYQLRTKNGRGTKLKRKAEELAQRIDCEVIDISRGGYSVEDFVSLFKYAQYVVTSSFHGTAFSVIFNRPLYSVMLNDGHDGRCKNLLTQIGAEAMVVELDDFNPTPQSIDYTPINERVSNLRRESIEYLNAIKPLQ